MFTYVAIFPNGKKYIGATTTSVEKRARDHLHSSKTKDTKFYRAIRKYGFENIEFRIIKEHNTIQEMFNSEKILIQRHQTQINGYNTTIGGEGVIGRIFTKEDKLKISIAQKKRFERPSERLKAIYNLKQWAIIDPEKQKQAIEKRTILFRTPERRKIASDKQKMFLLKNPNHLKIMSEKFTNIFKNDYKYRLKISKTLGGTPIKVYKNGVHIATYLSKNVMCKAMGLNQGNVCAFFNGKRNHVKGYTFEKDASIIDNFIY